MPFWSKFVIYFFLSTIKRMSAFTDIAILTFLKKKIVSVTQLNSDGGAVKLGALNNHV